jgi:spoIIIJ-associated protein
MRTVEKEGKNVEWAVEAACEELGIDPASARVEVLVEPKEFMGVVTRKAKVRVSIPEKSEAPSAPAKPEIEALKFRKTPPPDADEGFDEDDHGRRSDRPVLDPNFDPAAALGQICRGIHPEAEVSAKTEDGRLVLNIACNGSGIFIGHRGQTLDALQYVINRMTGKQNPGHGRIVVDSENYRERKHQRLVDDAWSMAHEVKRKGRPVTSEPLSAFDRRIIHMTLREDGAVTTKSLGDGEYKRVQVTLIDER